MPLMKSLSDDHAELFMSIARTVTPEVASLDADGRSRMTAIVDEALMERDLSTRKQLGTFLGLIRIAPLLRYGRTFPSLDAGRRTAVLRWFEGPIYRFINRKNEESMQGAAKWLAAHPDFHPELNDPE